MTRLRWLAIAAFGCFLVVLTVRLPLRWLQAALPEGVRCNEPAGTVWQGACASVEWQGQPRGALSWSLQPWRLVTGQLAAQLRLAGAGTSISGDLGAGFDGSISGRAVRADVTLGATPLPGVPANIRGRVHAELERVDYGGKGFTALLGKVEVHGFEQIGAAGPLRLGNHEIVFDAPADSAGRIHGRIRDLGGPLSVEATLTLTPGPGYLLEGNVAARADAAPELAQQITYLGRPDAAGRRPFAQEATF
jgi:hypothetical protein